MVQFCRKNNQLPKPKKAMKNRLLLFVFVFLINPLFAQHYYFRSYSIEEGLIQSEANSLAQDQNGAIWIGTNGGGLARFNGKTFENFNKKNGLSDDIIGSVFVDSKNRVWSQGYQGISVLEKNKFTNFDNMLKGFTSVFVEDAQGRIWILIFAPDQIRKLYIFENGKMTDFSEKNAQFFQNKQLNALIKHQNRILLSIDNTQIVELKGEQILETDLGKNPVFEGKNMLPVFSRSNGELWLISFLPTQNPRLFSYQNGIYTEIPLPNFLQNNLQLFSFQEHPDGSLWALGNTTLIRYQNSEFVEFDDKKGFPKNGRSRSLCIDQEGNIWVGKGGLGIVKFSGEKFLAIDRTDGMESEIVRTFSEDSQNRIWIGNMEGYITLFDGKNLEHLKIPFPNLGRTNSIVEEQNRMLIATDGGLFEYKNKIFRKINEEFKIPANLGVASIHKKDDSYLFSVNGFGIIDYQKGDTSSITPQNSNLPNSVVQDIFKDSNGNIWLASTAGVAMFNGKNKRNMPIFDAENGLYHDLCLQIGEDKWKNSWLVNYAGGGLFRFNGKHLERFSTENISISSDQIYSLVFDKNGSLWIGTGKGIDKISFDKNGNIEKVKNLGKYDGFTGIETNGRAAFVDSKGGVWFGTVKGAFRYDEQKDVATTKNLIQIHKIKLFFREINWTSKAYEVFHKGFDAHFLPKELHLPADSNHISIEFEALSFKNPENIRYQWRLLGIDKTWTPISQKTEAIYPNLPAGHYVFELKACNSDGVWNEKPISFEFTILPPFWQTWWFRLLGVGLVLGVTFGGFRWRIELIKAKQRELERLVTEKTKEVVEQKNAILEINTELKIQQEEIIAQNDQINHQHDELNALYKNVTSSIQYARRIQDAMLDIPEKVLQILPENFILYRPRDIVSGDFYWFQEKDGLLFIAAADCTGHGVPGAFMSMIGEAYLSQIVLSQGIIKADLILNELHKSIRKALKQDQSSNRDGMDIALTVLDQNNKSLEYAAARNPFVYWHNGEMQILKGDKMSIGGLQKEAERLFTCHKLSFQTGDKLLYYIFTDGLQDQFGGSQGRKLMRGRLYEQLQEVSVLEMSQQQQILEQKLDLWIGKRKQIDDILLIGVKFLF